MKSVLDTSPSNIREETIEERVLYELILKLMVQAECAFVYGDNENAFRLYISIKSILVLFVACGLTVDERYWAWVDTFSEELLPNM